ncbi:hypothetical protein AB0K05_29505 [Nonomuraea sp. NPDC049486]|uniref:hypothetical protein n=1 Tax=unclassified Nonomuraea TaxID=2593643 RepID=UPI0034126010
MTWPGEAADGADEGEGLFVMPAFEVGGRVERTGIALVHEGEYVVPAPGSEAVFSQMGGATRVVWNFPVEVEVVGALSDEQVGAVARHVFDELDVALRRQGRA